MPTPARRLTADELKTLASVHIRIREYDRRIDREDQSYSNWFVVAAVAGFSVSITHANALHVDESAVAKGLFFAVLAVFLLSISAGVFVRRLGNKKHSYALQEMTLEEIQYLNLHLSPPSAPEKDMTELTGSVRKGCFLGRERRQTLKETEKKIDRVRSLRKGVSTAQQILVGVAYLTMGSLSVLEHM